MLTLTRTIGETIRIGDDIEVHVVEVRGNTVRLGFNAPREVSIHRAEVYEQIAAARRVAVRVAADAVGALTAALGGTRGSATATRAPHEDGDTAAPALA
ncbi:MAG: carbon storage regulator, CsrA [Klenkia sp.]|nr:carbon storage regulator, CsrA [Klenkia sp.]